MVAPMTIGELRGRRFAWAGGTRVELIPVVGIAPRHPRCGLVGAAERTTSWRRVSPGALPALGWVAVFATDHLLHSGGGHVVPRLADRGGVTTFADSANATAMFLVFALAIIPCVAIGLAVVHSGYADRIQLAAHSPTSRPPSCAFGPGSSARPTASRVLGTGQRFDRVNESWCMITGQPSSDFVDRPWRDFVATDHRSWAQLLTQFRDEPGQVRSELTIRRPDGTTRLVMGSVHVIPLQDGTSEVVVQLVDLTERRLTEDRLREPARNGFAGSPHRSRSASSNSTTRAAAPTRMVSGTSSGACPPSRSTGSPGSTRCSRPTGRR